MRNYQTGKTTPNVVDSNRGTKENKKKNYQDKISRKEWTIACLLFRDIRKGILFANRKLP